MSYDFSLLDPDTSETIQFEEVHDYKGGTLVVGGTKEAWLNVTYNYSAIFRTLFGDKGITCISRMTGEESIPILEKAIAKLGDDVDPDYWKATEGNAKVALIGLLAFAKKRPDGIWECD